MGYALYFSFCFGLVTVLLRSCFGLGLVQFLPLICGRLLADLDSSHVLIVIIYSDVRDSNIMDSST